MKYSLKKESLSRRTLLKGFGAAPLFPLLTSMARDGYASDSQDVSHPIRLLIFFTPNGTNAETWFPDVGPSYADNPSDFTLKPLHSALIPFKEKLTMLRGVHLKSTVKGAGEPHQRGMGAVLTGRHLQEGDMVGGNGETAGWADGISLDQFAANAIGNTTPRKSLELGVRVLGASVTHRMCYAGAGQPLPPATNPMQVWSQLFSGAESPFDEQVLAKQAHKSVLDAARAQYAALRKRVGQADRIKLEQHTAMLRALEVQLLSFADLSACSVPGQATIDGDTQSESVFAEVSRAQIDLLAASLACDVTRVATLQYSSGANNIRFPHLNSFSDDHMLSHAGPSDATSREEWAYRQGWYANEFAYLLAKLDSIPEGDGTVLDNTMVLWCSELGEGASHSHDDVPFVLAGGAGGAVPMNRYLQYSDQPHNNLLSSLLTAVGVPTEYFGDPDFATGLLPGLLG